MPGHLSQQAEAQQGLPATRQWQLIQASRHHGAQGLTNALGIGQPLTIALQKPV